MEELPLAIEELSLVKEKAIHTNKKSIARITFSANFLTLAIHFGSPYIKEGSRSKEDLHS